MRRECCPFRPSGSLLLDAVTHDEMGQHDSTLRRISHAGLCWLEYVLLFHSSYRPVQDSSLVQAAEPESWPFRLHLDSFNHWDYCCTHLHTDFATVIAGANTLDGIIILGGRSCTWCSLVVRDRCRYAVSLALSQSSNREDRSISLCLLQLMTARTRALTLVHNCTSTQRTDPLATCAQIDFCANCLRSCTLSVIENLNFWQGADLCRLV